MAVYNTPSDAANTAVRAFLTRVGALYWGLTFNTNSGRGKRIWAKIKNEIFDNRCAYCDKRTEKIQMEHVIMFNREEFGLHHPGNLIPVCSKCNTRSVDSDGKHLSWPAHLKKICELNNKMDSFQERKNRIYKHISQGEFAYPNLSKLEKDAIRVIAETLYTNILNESNNAYNLYGKITKAFVVKST